MLILCKNVVKAVLKIFSFFPKNFKIDRKFVNLPLGWKFIRKGVIHMNPGVLIIALIGGISGGLATLYLTISFPGVIIWKLYRKIVHHIPMTK